MGEPGQISDRCERGRMKYGKAAGRSGRKVYGCKRMGAETLVAFRQIQDPQQGSLWDPFCGGIKKKNSVRSFFIFLSFLSPHGESRRGGLKSVPCEGRIKTGSMPVSDRLVWELGQTCEAARNGTRIKSATFFTLVCHTNYIKFLFYHKIPPICKSFFRFWGNFENYFT